MTIDRESIAAAMGEALAPLVLKNATVLNVYTGELLESDVAIRDGIILGVGRYQGEHPRQIGWADKSRGRSAAGPRRSPAGARPQTGSKNSAPSVPPPEKTRIFSGGMLEYSLRQNNAKQVLPCARK